VKPFSLASLLFAISLCACSSLFPPANQKVSRLDEEAKDPKEEKAELAMPKRRILVLSFLNRTAYQEEGVGNTAWDAMKRTLSQNPQIVLVPEAEFGQALPHNAESLEYDLAAIFRLARNQGIAGVLGGSVEDITVADAGEDVGLFRSRMYTVRATVRMQLYDTRSESEIFNRTMSDEVSEELTTLFGSRTPTASDPDRVRGAVAKTTEKLAGELPPYLKRVEWIGRIAKIDLHRYYINAGELSGIRVGQLMKVYGEGTPVKDEISNTFLGVAPGPFKGILKIVDYFGNDGAVAVVHSGAGFRERDRVEIISSPKN
jgi:hypothetical protein